MFMKKTGSFEYTLKVLATLRKELDVELDRLGGNIKITKVLSFLDDNPF